MSYTPTTWANGDTITAEKMNNIEQGVESVNMSYTPTTWANGDTITAQKMNNIEQGIVDASSGGGGDFSTATLTYSKNGNSATFDLKAPIVTDLGGTEALTFAGGLTAATNLQTVTVGLYKGLAYVYIGNELDSVTGDIEADEDGYYFVTGDCAVVLSY